MAFALPAALSHRTDFACHTAVTLSPPQNRYNAPTAFKRVRVVCDVGETRPVSTTTVHSAYWQWDKFGCIHYRHAGTTGPIVLFVAGFGCGAFHFESNVAALGAQGFRVYAIDKLGLGKSTVANADVANNVTLSLWRDQIIAFIDQVLQRQQVFLAGNSLGGLLTAAVCAARPDLIHGAILLNAAPFWISIPLSTPTFVRNLLGALVNNWWRWLTDPNILRRTLRLVYVRDDLVSDTLVQNILQPTMRQHARTVFRSVLLSPPLHPYPTLDAAARSAFRNIPLALINGARDPWVGPVWAMRLKHSLPDATLYELNPVGHCPHDEAAPTVDFLLSEWIHAVADQRPPPTFGSVDVPVSIGDISVITKNVPTSIIQRLAKVDNLFFTFLLATIESVL